MMDNPGKFHNPWVDDAKRRGESREALPGKMVEFDFPNTRSVHMFCITISWPGTPIAQHLVPDGRYSNRHPRKSPFCLSPSPPFSPSLSLSSVCLHLSTTSPRVHWNWTAKVGATQRERDKVWEQLRDGLKSKKKEIV